MEKSSKDEAKKAKITRCKHKGMVVVPYVKGLSDTFSDVTRKFTLGRLRPLPFPFLPLFSPFPPLLSPFLPPSPFPPSSPFPPFPSPLLSLPLRSSPPNPARGSGGAL